MTKIQPSAPLRSPHGSLLRRKAKDNPTLASILGSYEKFSTAALSLVVSDKNSVFALVEAFNAYRNEAVYLFESGKNVPQENLRSTMLEELFSWLFKDLFAILQFDQPTNYWAGKATSSYLTLTFAPKNFQSLFEDPNPKISKKDQDFAIGATVAIKVMASKSDDSAPALTVILPVVAIECKTYLAKNHLDMCSATAQSLKRANPYCMYLIATEFLKMDSEVTPEVTDISEIFILCKAENAERKKRQSEGKPPHPMHADVVWELFSMVMGHLRAVWWDPASSLDRGKVIGRPF
ncbi:Bpu10I family restriction endonuclease [Bradyrhizobium sp. TM239]|uniref:Bpu10I family restriction endonuclease n=1 Tax=Bradyrhizobium sp. TM239 TaxID=2599802 RepID=UPI0027D707E2|nr:hypothetical protein TM239_05050 [Bradyrhizobium sp. TM239]